MENIISVPKGMFKSRTFLIVLSLMVMAVVVGILQSNGIEIPEMVMPLITGFATMFVGAEKIKDAKEVSSNILNNIEKKMLVQLKDSKQLVNEKAVEVIGGIGILLNVILIIMDSNGSTISPYIYGSLNSIMSAFVGFDKYKEMAIKTATNIKIGGKKNP